jgi:hypothetical protein
VRVLRDPARARRRRHALVNGRPLKADRRGVQLSCDSKDGQWDDWNELDKCAKRKGVSKEII